MDEPARARSAARAALNDVTPPPLHDLLDTRLTTATMTPGVLTLLSSQVAGQVPDATDVDRRAAGVQLIYDGLNLTRRLARIDATHWPDDANMDVLAADVLVARGFHLLSHTEAASKAVETVQALGRDETNRAAGRTTADQECSLETHVFELAIIAGVTATGNDPPAGKREFSKHLTESFDDCLPSAPELLSDPAIDALEALITERGPAALPDEPMWVRHSVTD